MGVDKGVVNDRASTIRGRQVGYPPLSIWRPQIMNPFDLFPGKDIKVTSGKGLCDFCSPPKMALWVYPCRTFNLPLPPGLKTHEAKSVGAWGACETCAELIEKNDRKQLVERLPIKEVHPIQRKVINLFYKNRIGDRFNTVRTGEDGPYDATVFIVDDKEADDT